jgi:hypothetical protein
MNYSFDIRSKIKDVIAKADNDKIIHTDWLWCALKPIQRLYNDFLAYRLNALNAVSYNGQTLVLEFALNNKYLLVGGLIYIENVYNKNDAKFIHYLNETDEELYIYYLDEIGSPTFIGYLIEGNLDFDFIVWVPTSLVFNKPQMASFILKYAIAGRRIIIKTY